MHVTTNDPLDLPTETGCVITSAFRGETQKKQNVNPGRAHLRALRSFLTLFGCLALVLSTPSVSMAQASHEFQFGVLNTFLRSAGMYCLQDIGNIADCMVNYPEVTERNAEKIAEALLFKDLDVIVFNEVFDEGAREILINELSPVYEHFVAKIDDELLVAEENEGEDDFAINGEDSGLMVFSRFEFEPLPNDDFKWDSEFLEGTTDEVAFIRYRETTGHDLLAAKGVGLVRVKDSANDQVYAIVFTHMQADSEHAQFPDLRKHQFEDVEKLITTTLGLSPLDHIFFAGDLNVRGEGAVIDGGSFTGGGDEWQQRFGSGFFNDTLIDAWAATTSMEDTGITTYGKLETASDDKRLDYILPSVASLAEGRCVQHIRRQELSPADHLLVWADYNLENPLCDPRRAWHNPPLDQFVEVQSGNVDLTDITNPGGAHWFFYDLTGGGSADETLTVSIGVPESDQFDPNTGTGVVYELYDPSNLSVPILQYQREETDLSVILDDSVENLTGIVHLVPERFFMKVFSPEPTWTGNYTFLVHEHTCASVEDRCILPPNESPRSVASFDPYVYVGQEDTMWYQIDVVEIPTSGGRQPVRVFAGPYTHDNFRIELVDREDPEEPVLFPPLTQDLPTFKEFEDEIYGVQSMFLVVARDDATLGDSLEVGWDTTLTTLHGRHGFSGAECSGADFWQAELRCLDETNPELGADEINLLVSFDDSLWHELGVFPFECNDGGVSYPIEAQLNGIQFVDNIRFKLIEEDGPILPDDEGPVVEIPTLAPHETVRARQHISWQFEGGHYQMRFNLSRCGM